MTKVRCKDLPHSDRGDFRCRRAVDSSSSLTAFLCFKHNSLFESYGSQCCHFWAGDGKLRWICVLTRVLSWWELISRVVKQHDKINPKTRQDIQYIHIESFMDSSWQLLKCVHESIILVFTSHQGKQHQIITRVSACTVYRESIYIISFLTPHTESKNDDKIDEPHTPCLICSVYKMHYGTQQLWRVHMKSDIFFVRYRFSFTAVFRTKHVKYYCIPYMKQWTHIWR